MADENVISFASIRQKPKKWRNSHLSSWWRYNKFKGSSELLQFILRRTWMSVEFFTANRCWDIFLKGKNINMLEDQQSRFGSSSEDHDRLNKHVTDTAKSHITNMTEHALCFSFLIITFCTDSVFLSHSLYRLFCCERHHAASACGWTPPDYCDHCSSLQSSRWEHSHQPVFTLIHTDWTFRAEMFLCALFSREAETTWWAHCEWK